MKKNIGATDKIIRIVAAIIFALLYITGTVIGTLGLVLLILGGVLLVTSIIGTCPLYLPFGLNTCAMKERR